MNRYTVEMAFSATDDQFDEIMEAVADMVMRDGMDGAIVSEREPLGDLATGIRAMLARVNALTAGGAPARTSPVFDDDGVTVYRVPWGGHVISKDGSWLPGAFATVEDALASIAPESGSDMVVDPICRDRNPGLDEWNGSCCRFPKSCSPYITRRALDGRAAPVYDEGNDERAEG